MGRKAGTQPLAQGDCVVILAHEEDIAGLCAKYALHSELEDAREEMPPEDIVRPVS